SLVKELSEELVVSETEFGFLKRIIIEIEHWTRKTWTFTDVGDHWDETDDYDDINSETYSYFRRFIDGLRMSDVPSESVVLDFCARTGYGTTYFYEHGKVRSAICADVSFNMGDICTKRVREVGLNSYLWVPVSDYTMPMAAASFDVVLCFETVEHFPEPEKMISELGRLTKPGGILVLTTPNVLWEPVHALAAITGLHHSEGPHRFIPYRRLLRMVENAGFNITKKETTVLIPGGPKWLVRIGEWIENRWKENLMPLLGLRRVIIGIKR
ncbi:class I SAM-dependent methyltransferase, partial [Chloroflexota bacterium]